MPNLKSLLLLVYLVCFSSALEPDLSATKNPATKFINCNPTNEKAQNEGCPKGSICVDNGTKESYCICSSNYTVNQDYNSGKEYCIKKNETVLGSENVVPSTTAVNVDPKPTAQASSTTASPAPKKETSTAPPSSTAKPTPTTATSPKPKTDAPTDAPKTPSTEAPKPTDDIKITPVPPHHHILGGIFIPTFIVLGFVCGAFAIKKYNLIEKARELIRNRNQHQRYNGLMENEFDDDDPLLI